MKFFQKHKKLIVMIGATLGTLAAIKFVASRFSDAPVVGKAAGAAAKYL